MLINVGRQLRFLVPIEVNSVSSVMLSLSLSMFAAAQTLTSFLHYCIEWNSLDILAGGVFICICMSSANE